MNGPLLEALAREIDYHDVECIEMFRVGAPLVGVATLWVVGCWFLWAPFRQVGELPLAGNGVANKVLEAAISEAELQCMRDDSNSEVLARLREDQHAEQLL